MIKKILCEPLFYLLPLLAVLYLIIVPVEKGVGISDITITRNDNTENIKLPYLIGMAEGEVFYVSFNLLVENKKSAKLKIIPDDCLQEISINGENFPLNGVKGLCDYMKGAYFDFSEHVADGLNSFYLTVKNNGGPGGVDVVVTSLERSSLMHWIFVFLLLISFSLMLWRFRSNERIFKLALLFIVTIIFWLVASNAGQRSDLIPRDSVAFLAAIFFGASLIFLFNKHVDYTTFIFILTMVAAFVLIRGGLLYFKSSDYNIFLASWVRQMQELSLREAISAKIGDYNMPYLYVLALISRMNINNLYLIKLVSIAFDMVLAYYAMKIVSIKFNSINVQITAFLAVLGIPTVMLNGAFWAQCDVVYSSLVLAMLYYGFTGKSIKCLIFFGLAFSVKLQTIFIAPMLIVFLFTKKIKVIHLWVPILTFFATLVPALIAKKPFMETFSIYYKQVNSYPHMEAGALNIYVLLGDVSFANFNFAAIFMAGIAVASLLYFLYLNREKITLPADYVSIAFVFTLIIPMLLPRMHERYFFLADVLSVVLVFFNKKRWFFAPVIIMGSFMTYSRFIIGKNYGTLIEYASIAMIFITVIAVKDLVERVIDVK
jgi:Gpi18-like mannosyltransferase